MDEMTLSLAGAAAVQPPATDARGPTQRQAAADVEAVEKVDPTALYSSPKGKLEASTGLFVLQIRDSVSGEVIQEFPADRDPRSSQATAQQGADDAPVEEPAGGETAAVAAPSRGSGQPQTTETVAEPAAAPVAGGARADA